MCSVSPIEETASKSDSGHVAVVHEPHLGQVVESLFLDLVLRPRGLLAGQGHAQRLDAVLLRGMPNHSAPAAPHVEQSMTGLEAELAGDQVVLLELGLLQRRIGGRVDGAGVGHRRPEDQLVEAVGDVVVVVDRLRVPALGVPQALHHPAPAGQRLLPGWGRRLEVRDAQRTQQRHGLGRRRAAELQPLLEHLERRVGVAWVGAVQGQVAHDVGAPEAQVARCGDEVGQSALVVQREA